MLIYGWILKVDFLLLLEKHFRIVLHELYLKEIHTHYFANNERILAYANDTNMSENRR